MITDVWLTGVIAREQAVAADVIWIGMGERRFLGIPAGSRRRDSEGTGAWEDFGAHRFAWIPRRCRNGRVSWLKTLERHRDGTYTLGRLH
jgi:hypothetical protein